MKLIRTLMAMAFAVALMTGPLMAGDKTCCEKAAAEGKDCTHKCCVEAKKEGKACEKCSAKKDSDEKKEDKKS